MFKILISDGLAEEGRKILTADPDVQLEYREKVPQDELKAMIKDYDALIIRSAAKVTKEILEAAPKLKVIGRAGVGIDNVDVPEATRRGIIVMNTPDGNTISTAEHTISMLLSLSRNIPQADASVKAGKWERKNFMGTEVYGKVLGIVGLGRIGTELAKRAQAFGMTIMAFDPFLTREKADKLQVKLASLDEIFQNADYISVHTPKNRETEGLIGKAQFAKMKPTVRLINCARGGIINQNDLKEALKSGKIAGAALDVYDQEPPADPELFTLPNIVMTPHLGASTEEAQINVAIIIAEQLLDALKGKTIRNAVNIPQVPSELLKEMSPYLQLSDKLGSFLAQVMDGQLKRITVKYAGEVTSYPTDLITVSAVKGMLSSMLSESLNFVNAKVLAKERGIEIVETSSTDTVDYASTITLEVEDDGKRLEITGTLIGKKREPYVVSVFGYHTDFLPQGNLLVFTHHDEPGIVGKMGSMLGNQNINIAALRMGRNEVGGEAVSILNVDSEISKELLAKLATAAPNIKKLKYVKL